jgi:enoyl-CoA hydratase/carnithine racemase
VVLSSALPGRFCGGLDLAMARRSSGAELRAFLDRLYGELFDVQYRLGKPSIAAVGGAARGAGMTLAVSCDMIVAGAGATFGYSEIDVGLFPGIHCAHLPRIIGRHRAFELLLSGRAFGAAEAAGLGLVNRVVPGEALDGEARALARTFAAKSPAVMRVARAAFMRANDLDYRRTIESMAETLCALIDTPDAREGLAAFLDKRPPRWPSAAPGDGGGASG